MIYEKSWMERPAMPEELETGPPVGEPPEHVHSESPAIEEIVEDISDTEDDIDELAEALAVHSIISEERHDEILERVDECRNRLEVLLPMTQAENPLLSQILSEMTAIRAELMSLKSSMGTRPNHPPPNESPSEEQRAENPEEPNQAPSIAEPSVAREEPEAQPAPKAKKNRFV
jgi:hypothetical protein